MKNLSNNFCVEFDRSKICNMKILEKKLVE